MPCEIVTIPCLADNYSFLVHDPASGDTALVDAPEAAPVLAALAERGWRPSRVLLTHHHRDHVDGLAGILAGILAEHPAQVIGAAADAARLPPLDRAVTGGDRFDFGGEPVEVIDVGGHTNGHIAYYLPQSRAVFTGDSLMALGCGRLFEGSAAQMWASLSRLAALPGDTLVCSGHEYSQANARFAVTVDPDNPDLAARVHAIDGARARNQPTVPSLLSLELATNPFLRVADPKVQRNLGMQGADPATVFAEIRARKDRF